MQTNNVVHFPKPYSGPTLNGNTKEDIQNNIEMIKHFHIQETISTVIPILFAQLEISGFPIDEENDKFDIKDSIFIVETLRAILCKYYDIDHPIQKVIDNIFEGEVESGMLKITKKLNIEFKNTEEV